MNDNKFIETLKHNCSFLDSEQFNLHQLENNLYYSKNLKDVGLRIRFHWINYGDTYYIQGVSADLRYNIIEKEIQAVQGGNFENYFTVSKKPDSNRIPSQLNIMKFDKNIRFPASFENEILLFSTFLRDFYFNEIIPFFDRYKDFDQAYRTYSKLTREEISSFIINSGNGDVFYRELIIRHLAKDSNLNKFINDFESEFKGVENNPTLEVILDRFLQIKSNLIE